MTTRYVVTCRATSAEWVEWFIASLPITRPHGYVRLSLSRTPARLKDAIPRVQVDASDLLSLAMNERVLPDQILVSLRA